MIYPKFYNDVDDNMLKFAVIVAMYNDKWVLCKHKDRSTYEWPGGYRENGEDIIQTAQRELYEETGAIDFEIHKISVYSVTDDINEKFGMLYFAKIKQFGELPDFEMESIELFDDLPENWTYPETHAVLPQKISEILLKNSLHE